MLFENAIRGTIELLAEAERNLALKQRLSRQKCKIISGQDEIDPGFPMAGGLVTNSGNSQKTDGRPDRPKMGRSDLSDLLQRLSVLTAIQDRCTAMASEIEEEQISGDRVAESRRD